MDSLDLQRILRILRRRVWLWLPIVCLGLTATTGIAFFLPNVYRASGFILVEDQKIPKEYVRSTVTTDIQNRLHSISQEILSRNRLAQLIQDYNLYPRLRAEASLQQVIVVMRKDIGIQINNVNRRRPSSVAFEVSYTGTDPETVTLVANRLASFYVEENLKLQERQALGTTAFLSDQLTNVKKQLEDQEQQIANFKRQHLGQLPEQLTANLKTLERLQAQLQLNSDNLLRARERRDLLLKELGQYRKSMSDQEIGNGTGRSSVAGGREGDEPIKEVTRSLAILRSRFSDNHPDVIRTLQELDALKQEQAARVTDLKKAAASASELTDPYIAQVRKQLREIDAEIRFLRQDLKDTREETAGYQKRIEETPRREQELMSLTRDYKSTKELYASLLKRKEEAELATSMEQRRKAERFRIVDSAVRPDLPEGPNRLQILLVGLVLSLALGGGALFLRELLKSSFDSAEDLQKVTDIPILVSIPRIRTQSDLRWARLRTALSSIILLISVGGIAAGSYYVAKGNESLVKRLTISTTGQNLR